MSRTWMIFICNMQKKLWRDIQMLNFLLELNWEINFCQNNTILVWKLIRLAVIVSRVSCIYYCFPTNWITWHSFFYNSAVDLSKAENKNFAVTSYAAANLKKGKNLSSDDSDGVFFKFVINFFRLGYLSY